MGRVCENMRVVFFALPALVALSAPALDKAAVKDAFSNKVEQLAEKMWPKKDVDEMLGFFGPVTKKYLPVFKQFNTEYLDGTNKIATVKKYLPKADAALAEATAMKVPARYEPQKAAYLKKLRGFLTVVNLTARFAE